ncbi:alanine racemase [Blautia liquoris]|uniref:Alanine racemase n=1 Tax=Blautia liquoris TaxID=2779518 RepID=A0A7M2REZ5_9FIRM|nr:alanine racemase [Blautia liquoris]QOV18718.1 alanine racemase [Blautia liquoris]
MKKEWLNELETPCIVIDMGKTKENIRKMQETASLYGCKLRPHIKTHKMPLFARMQIAAGADGITCAKVSEAEVMAEGGIDDIFIAYPLIGKVKIKRAISLLKKVKRLILAVDSMECAIPLNEAAKNARVRLEVRMEVDTGAKRTGVVRERAVELAKEIAKLSNLELTGIYTFKSLVYKDKPTQDKVIAGKEEGELMELLTKNILAAGINIKEISAGSTPTGEEVAKTGKVTEIRPGTYIFKDFMLCKEGAASFDEIAVRYYATVVSTPCKEYAVIDGGTKTFPMDIMLDTEPYYYPGYALIEGNDDLQLRRMNEEHGIITSKKGETGLKVGDTIVLVPIHVCTAINMQNSVYIDYGDCLQKEVVKARGMLV